MYRFLTSPIRVALNSRIYQSHANSKLWQFGGSITRHYTVKGLSVEELKEKAQRIQEEGNRQRREAREAALAAQKQQQETSSDKPTSDFALAQAHDKSRKDSSPVKPLSNILNTSRIVSTPHTPEQVSQLWNAYHMSRSGGTGRGFLCASIPLDLYNKMSAVAEKYPTFIVPIRRPRDVSAPPVEGENDGAYEFFLLQWDFHDAPPAPSAIEDPFTRPSSVSPNPKISTVLFTPLGEYKLRNTFATPYLVLTNYTNLASTHGLVLLRGEITPSSGASGNYMLSQENAQQLSMAIQKFYLWGNGEGEGEKLVKTFHERPEEFRWEDLLRVGDWGI
ncbi:ATP11-domain-containing protein [Macrolepiota fuliginosa MF-IS2]|uniref:ATP11-domain-containing protein n=1 Tax=Macrolepiota fuliginosa MF-IS2 TaxID=1400762 RepID=A0A9P6CAG5_9AGAR|nr:ATP11-domain-containing protein [Macrolepiota fuliginosa MF-IS2]